jgi:hypothetical protein
MRCNNVRMARRQRQRIARRPDERDDTEHVIVLGIGHVDLRFRDCIKPREAEVGGDANDGQERATFVEPNAAANRVLSRKVAARESLVEHDSRFVIGDPSSSRHPEAHDARQRGRRRVDDDGFEPGELVDGRLGRTLHDQTLRERHAVRGNIHRFHSGFSAQTVEQRVDDGELPSPCLAVSRVREFNLRCENLRGLEARRMRSQTPRALQHQPCADQQHQRERDLCGEDHPARTNAGHLPGFAVPARS